MNINDVWNFVNFIANKQQSGTITPTQFNLAAQRAQLEYYNNEYRKFQTTREATDAIAIWLVESVQTPNSVGQIPYPSDYKHVSAIRGLYWNNNVAIPVAVREVTDNDLGAILMSQVCPPTPKYPVMAYYSNFIQMYPITTTIQFDYLRGPVVPIWGYTVVNNRPVYNPATSTDLEALDGSQTEICFMILSYIGIYLDKQTQIQYSEMLKQQKP